ncbi:MAG: hypothetical protein KBC30_08255 [Planctomycetes bacterium]|nr:hypothetical protein [Planctomycetota bacterium]HPY74834.1 hypothetical protein [Planctomycetota bacterium]HQB01538.1 hypothetical protein [Planctomycetota bacterium]
MHVHFHFLSHHFIIFLLLWGGKCYSGEAKVALGRQTCSGEANLLWGKKFALGS